MPSAEGEINRTKKSTQGEGGEVTLQGSEKLVNPGVFVGEARPKESGREDMEMGVCRHERATAGVLRDIE